VDELDGMSVEELEEDELGGTELEDELDELDELDGLEDDELGRDKLDDELGDDAGRAHGLLDL